MRKVRIQELRTLTQSDSTGKLKSHDSNPDLLISKTHAFNCIIMPLRQKRQTGRRQMKKTKRLKKKEHVKQPCELWSSL